MRGDDAGQVTAAECFLLVIDSHGPAWIPILPPGGLQAGNPQGVLDTLRREAEARLNGRRAPQPGKGSAEFRETADPAALRDMAGNADGSRLLRAVLECSESRAMRDLIRGVISGPRF
jgi:hypothetical protein